MASERNPEERIVITGMGCVSPLGLDVESTWQSIVGGQDGIVSIRETTLAEYPQLRTSVAAPVGEFNLLSQPDLANNFTEKDLRKIHRSAQFTIWAGLQALEQAGLIRDPANSLHINGDVVNPDRVAIRIGTGIGGGEELARARLTIDAGKRVVPSTILQVLPERVASTSSMTFGIKGSTHEITGACATGNMNIIAGAQVLKLGEADIVLVGGTEAQITPECIALFEGTTALDNTEDPAFASRPFHQASKGFVIGEGAGLLVMETLANANRRGAEVLAELVGYGETADAYHDTAPSGKGAVRALRLALKHVKRNSIAGVYVNAHATGTGGDSIELQSIGEIFDPREVAGISSTKGATGHLLGAAGAFESIISIKSLQDGIIPPSLKLDDPIPETKHWNMSIGEATEVESLDLTVNDSFGFGGLNAVTAYGHV